MAVPLANDIISPNTGVHSWKDWPSLVLQAEKQLGLLGTPMHGVCALTTKPPATQPRAYLGSKLPGQLSFPPSFSRLPVSRPQEKLIKQIVILHRGPVTLCLWAFVFMHQ